MSVMDDLHLTLSRRFRDGQLPEAAYHAHCINYASHLASKGDIQEATRILGHIPDAFFDRLAAGASVATASDALVVESFVMSTVALAEALVAAGIVAEEGADTVFVGVVSTSKGMVS